MNTVRARIILDWYDEAPLDVIKEIYEEMHVVQQALDAEKDLIDADPGVIKDLSMQLSKLANEMGPFFDGCIGRTEDVKLRNHMIDVRNYIKAERK